MTKTEMIETVADSIPKKDAKIAVDIVLNILAEMDAVQVDKLLNKIRARKK